MAVVKKRLVHKSLERNFCKGLFPISCFFPIQSNCKRLVHLFKKGLRNNVWFKLSSSVIKDNDLIFPNMKNSSRCLGEKMNRCNCLLKLRLGLALERGIICIKDLARIWRRLLVCNYYISLKQGTRDSKILHNIFSKERLGNTILSSWDFKMAIKSVIFLRVG